MPAPLTIYRASAGAGKTFRLVVEYIKLLTLRPDEYRHILAVTFTKKATQEMKIRILSQLYGLREGLSSSDAYMECIVKEMGVPPHEVRRNAGKALELILNDYSHFRIETIDSFFQSVLRNMTRELDISANMRVELNGEQVKDKAIDEMIEGLQPTDHIFQRIVSFAEDNMNEGKTWNIVGSLKKFGSNIFTDFYQCHAEDYKRRQAENKNLFRDYSKGLRALKAEAVKSILNAADELWGVFDAQGVDIGIFKNSAKSGLVKMREYIANGNVTKVPGTVNKYADSDDEWLKKADVKRYGMEAVSDVFRPALNKYLILQRQLTKLIHSVDALLQNLNSIELLGAIESAVDESNVKANRFLLSSTNHLLAEMIGDSDSPFIYEKIGTRISHLMIDEFQDTSTLQWHNFKRLMLESMSHYDAKTARGTVGSMIVGDVKQSIYRWRNGDWRLLSGIKQEFPNESDTEVRDLAVNYRSEANIIEFNNAFFEEAKSVCQYTPNPYDGVRQLPKPGRKPQGEVRFFMLEKDDYKSRHTRICDHVAQLISQGVAPKDIAILGRNNKILKELAQTFMDFYPDIRVVSMESFQISSSMAVSTIICALRLLQKPNDKIQLAVLEHHSQLSAEECRRRLSTISLAQPLHDIVEAIFLNFGIEEMTSDSAYTSAFFDFLRDFTSRNTATIRDFLKAWDETISQKSIETEAADGVQLMTIHKSKGLEFDNVIIADGAWSDGVERNRIWLELNEQPFNGIPFTNTPVNERLEQSVFSEEYAEECRQNAVDNLNLLYVAFTRAAKNLYFYGQTGGKNGISSLVERCLLNMGLRAEDNVYSYGSFAPPQTSHETSGKAEKNVFQMPSAPLGIHLRVNQPAATFTQSNRSKQFISGADSEEKENTYISTGLLLHNVLSQIQTLDDVERTLRQFEAEGVMESKSQANLIRKRILDSKRAREWFSDEWTVYNECSILTPQGTRRPDRVITNGKRTMVIDFKFGTPKPEHREQVAEYKRLLEQMDFPKVEAYLWYVYTDTVLLIDN